MPLESPFFRLYGCVQVWKWSHSPLVSHSPQVCGPGGTRETHGTSRLVRHMLEKVRAATVGPEAETQTQRAEPFSDRPSWMLLVAALVKPDPKTSRTLNQATTNGPGSRQGNGVTAYLGWSTTASKASNTWSIVGSSTCSDSAVPSTAASRRARRRCRLTVEREQPSRSASVSSESSGCAARMRSTSSCSTGWRSPLVPAYVSRSSAGTEMPTRLRIARRSRGVVHPTYPATSVCTTALYRQSASSGQAAQDVRALTTRDSYVAQVCLSADERAGGSSSSGCR